MKIADLPTPSILVDRDILKKNITAYQSICSKNGKKMLPMAKTHKSSEVMRLQMEAGAWGILAATIDEAEAACRESCGRICFAYPITAPQTLDRIRFLCEKTEIILSLDTLACAQRYEAYFSSFGLSVSYLCIVDVGLDRFGVPPADAGSLVKQIAASCPHLRFSGISSHPGQVYKESSPAGVRKVERQELDCLKAAKDSLFAEGFSRFLVHSGSTPTFLSEAESDVVDVLRPGNYVFHDAIQQALGACGFENCAMSVLAEIISIRPDGRYLMNCGAKCLGLDKGAHGNSSINGYGHIIEYPEAEVLSLSEEVGIIKSKKPLSLGEKIRIIPNHSCSTANLTSYAYILHGEDVAGLLSIDCRNNSRIPVID